MYGVTELCIGDELIDPTKVMTQVGISASFENWSVGPYRQAVHCNASVNETVLEPPIVFINRTMAVGDNKSRTATT